MKISATLLTLVALLTLSACSPSDTTTNTSTQDKKISESNSYDPCELLTASDVGEFFPEATVTLDRHDTEGNPIGMKICFYSASEEDMKFAQLAVITAAEAPSGIVEGNSLRPLYDSERALLNPSDIQEVSGLGNAAYYGGSGLKVGAGLHVIEDTHGVKIDISVGLGKGNSDQAEHIRIEKALAEKALSRL